MTSQVKAIMLLTVSFGKFDESNTKPLTIAQWARFAVWLKNHDLEPSDLLKGCLKTLLSDWMDRSITLSRLESLLNRGRALGLALEKWQRAGLWVITRSDSEYPQRLKRLLGSNSPPVLFGCGNKALLEGRGIAVVGSRDADQDDIDFAASLGDIAARQEYSVVSGGARGVDEKAMLGALKNRGTAIGVLANGLLHASTSAKYRKYLLSDHVVLMTPFNPEIGFHVGYAMLRNRYIYCLADAAVVVSSTPKKGGTWKGATENLNAAWRVPLWVRHTENAKSGNPDLVQKGASWITEDLINLKLSCLVNRSPVGAARDGISNLPLDATGTERPATPESETQASEAPIHEIEPDKTQPQTVVASAPTARSIQDQSVSDFYTLFLLRMDDITDHQPMKTEDIARSLGLMTSQVSTWLKRGVEEGKIEKRKKPTGYQSSKQGRLLVDDG